MMKEYSLLNQKRREIIIKAIKKTLLKRGNIVFAFIYGSFLDAPSFRDIDIGVYIDGIKKEEVFDTEIELAQLISEALDMPIDIIEVKILNFATNSFLSNIFSRGKLIFSKNDKLLSDLIEIVSLTAIENEHIAEESFRELIPA